jgi:hypothetical protein
MPDQSDSNLPPLRKDKLIVDAGGGSVPPDIRVMIDDLAEVLGAEVVEGTILPCQVLRVLRVCLRAAQDAQGDLQVQESHGVLHRDSMHHPRRRSLFNL